MNLFIFTGNLGGDAEIRYTKDNKPVLNFSAAARSGYGKYEKTIWVSCALWGERGEKIAPYLKKGTRVVVSGELGVDEWQSKEDGKERYKITLRVSQLDFAGQQEQNQAPQQQAPQQQTIVDDDIPF